MSSPLDKLGIKVANNGGGNAVAVAEHSIALMVSVYRNLKRQFQSVQDRQWAADIHTTWFPNAYELTDKIVGIIGLGRIGQQVARRLQGWDCRLIYHDVTGLPTAREKALNITKVDFDELLRTSDMITLHVPLSRLTKGMMNDRAFAVQNVARVASGEAPQSIVDPV
ncbi:MAG: NAD(P)-dependent oxidoreductase [bacterium]|nr:NAD(P)-dependent oxidoreductase [bacterium]